MALNLWQNLGLKVRQQSSQQTVETQQTAIANTAASRQHSRDSSQQTVLANRDTADGRELTTNAVRAATQVCIDSCEWPVDGPVHLSLEQIDKIALGGLSGEPIPHMAPVQNCFGRSAAIAATKGSKLVGAIGATEVYVLAVPIGSPSAHAACVAAGRRSVLLTCNSSTCNCQISADSLRVESRLLSTDYT